MSSSSEEGGVKNQIEKKIVPVTSQIRTRIIQPAVSTTPAAPLNAAIRVRKTAAAPVVITTSVVKPALKEEMVVEKPTFTFRRPGQAAVTSSAPPAGPPPESDSSSEEEEDDGIEEEKAVVVQAPLHAAPKLTTSIKKRTVLPATRKKAIEMFKLGVALQAQRRLPAAMEKFTEAVGLDDTFAAPYYYRGGIQASISNFNDAIADFDKFLALETKAEVTYPVYLARSVTHQRRGDLELAVADLSKAIEINPKGVKAYNTRKNLYMTSGKIALAAADANAVALLQPTAANYFNVGQCFLQGKAYDAAVSTLSSAIETVDQKDPQLFMLYHLRGSANLQLKALDKAIGDLTTAIELAPQLKALVSYNARSVCYAQLNQLQLANKDCDWVLALSPNDANAKRTKAFVTQRM